MAIHTTRPTTIQRPTGAPLAPRSSTTTRIAPRTLVWAGPVTIAVAVLANLAIRAVAVAFFGVPDAFMFLQVPIVVGSTVLFLLPALVAFALVGRFSRRPRATYRLLALVALLLSLASPAMALAGAFPVPGMSVTIFWTMITMHVVTALIAVGLLTRLATRK